MVQQTYATINALLKIATEHRDTNQISDLDTKAIEEAKKVRAQLGSFLLKKCGLVIYDQTTNTAQMCTSLSRHELLGIIEILKRDLLKK